MLIHLLEEHLINKIAAGEVIERAGSVVKELVENSIDASSSRITVKIFNGGLDRIEVEDDGRGILPEDIPLAFMRHATSKIKTEKDLYHINSMGFRGEALPSIASISQIELYTAAAETQGMRTVIEGGKAVNSEPFACPLGTKIIVKNIFYNTPARRKFQKSPVSENMHIYDTMLRLAISHPAIAFKFSNDKKTYFKTPGNGNLMDTLLAIYGQDYVHNLLPIEYSGDNISITGMISRPEYKRLNRKNQIYYINQRFIQNQVIARAVDEAYRGFLITREYPAVLLFLNVDQQDVDINVHPQKLQVRFRDERAIFKLVSQVLREHLSRLSYTLSPGGAVSSPEPKTVFDRETKPVWAQGSLIDANSFSQARSPFPPAVGYQAQPAAYTLTRNKTEGLNLQEAVPDPENDFIIIGQLFSSYIVVEKGDKFWLVDQHAAHERINYYNFHQYNDNRDKQVQNLLIPLALEVSENLIDVWEKYSSLIRNMGFLIEKLGYSSIVVRGVPVYLKGREEETIRDLLDMLADQKNPDIQEEALIMMACKQAVKAGELLTNKEMYRLIHDLVRVENYWHCPHGRPTILEMDHEEINRKFKR